MKHVSAFTLFALALIAAPALAVQVPDRVCDASGCRIVVVEVPGTLSGTQETSARAQLAAAKTELETNAASDTPDEARVATLIASYDATEKTLFGPLAPSTPRAQRMYDEARIKKFKAKAVLSAKDVADVVKIMLRQRPDAP